MPGNFESVRNVALQKETFPQLRGAGENRHKGYKRHSATIAVAGRVPLDVLWHAVPSFPTLSEVWLHLLEAYGL